MKGQASIVGMVFFLIIATIGGVVVYDVASGLNVINYHLNEEVAASPDQTSTLAHDGGRTILGVTDYNGVDYSNYTSNFPSDDSSQITWGSDVLSNVTYPFDNKTIYANWSETTKLDKSFTLSNAVPMTAQSFTPTHVGNITSVYVRMFWITGTCPTSGGSYRAVLAETYDGVPIAASPYQVIPLTIPYWYQFPMTTPHSIDNYSQLWLRIEKNVSYTGCSRIFDQDNGEYEGGRMYFEQSGWHSTNDDLGFVVTGDIGDSRDMYVDYTSGASYFSDNSLLGFIAGNIAVFFFLAIIVMVSLWIGLKK